MTRLWGIRQNIPWSDLEKNAYGGSHSGLRSRICERK